MVNRGVCLREDSYPLQFTIEPIPEGNRHTKALRTASPLRIYDEPISDERIPEEQLSPFLLFWLLLSEDNRMSLVGRGESKFQSELKHRWIFLQKIREAVVSVRKKRIGEEESIFFLLSVFAHFNDFIILSHTNFYSTFPEFILQRTPFPNSNEFLPTSWFYDFQWNHIKTIPIWYSYLCKDFTIKK